MWDKKKSAKQPKKNKDAKIEFPEFISIANYESDWYQYLLSNF